MIDAPPPRPRVLAIDGSEDVRALYRELLRDEGYDAEALDCREAERDRIREMSPDVVVLDCFLGCDPSGWELQQVLSLDPVLQRVPIVICTTDTHMSGSGDSEALTAGIQMLSKPFELPDLLSAIETALQGSAVGRAD